MDLLEEAVKSATQKDTLPNQHHAKELRPPRPAPSRWARVLQEGQEGEGQALHHHPLLLGLDLLPALDPSRLSPQFHLPGR